ncbi:MAG: RHS repeat-associated core domain-containing protein, partial [Rudaea sp.]
AGASQWNWPWQTNPFGETTPTGAQAFNLRFPGQYFDSETGLNYNYFRDYEPGTGRYVESDPIGLQAGTNTYAYVLSRPNRFRDPFGLDWQSDMTYTFCPDGTCLLPPQFPDPYAECRFRCFLELIPFEDFLEHGIAHQIHDDLGRFVFHHLASRALLVTDFVQVMICLKDCKKNDCNAAP